MAVYLVTYDLNKEVKRPPIVDKIKEVCTSWAMLSESSYAITHNGSPDDVYNAMKPLLDQNDQIYIIALKQPWQGFGPKEVNEWLSKNLSY
jgi:hypothetical protein